MSTEIDPGDWRGLDPWWSAYERTRPIARALESLRLFDADQVAAEWAEIDPWVRAIGESSLVTGTASAQVFSSKRLIDEWVTLDPWWGEYIDTGHETAIALSNELEQSNELWKDSEAPFDTDPLSADLTRARHSRGPLQPGGEVDWSRWLAQLLEPSSELVTELFDVCVDESPEAVVREDRLPKEDDGFRRPDVLVIHADQGISIEVKLGDENYEKTAETARLVERHYEEREWTHTLLLPKRMTNRLDARVTPSFVDRGDGSRQIEWERPGGVDVLYWRDVTAAIRLVLQRGAAVDDHWASNAYLFCAVAEQQLMDFQPKSVVDRLADPSNVADTLQPIEIAGVLEKQLTYLREMAKQ